MRNTLIKLAVVALVVKEIWLLLGVESVNNALVSFLMAGEVPGTKRVMSPDEVIRLVSALGILLLIIIFRKSIFGLIARMWHGPKQQPLAEEHAEQVAAMPIEHPIGESEPAPAEPVKAKKQQLLKPMLIIKQSPLLRLWARKLQSLATFVWIAGRAHVVRLSLLAAKYGQIAAVYTATHLRKWSIVTWQTIRAYTRLTIQYLGILWKRTEPHLRRFDGWLERKLHEYEKTAFMLSLGSEMTATVQKWRNAAKSAASSVASSKEPENK
ncbi:MAG TPA: hypothetical protein VIR03_00995 [Candidatus Saccharimonadales bacterium]